MQSGLTVKDITFSFKTYRTCRLGHFVVLPWKHEFRLIFAVTCWPYMFINQSV